MSWALAGRVGAAVAAAAAATFWPLACKRERPSQSSSRGSDGEQLIFPPSRVVPESRIYKRGRGASLNPKLFSKLNAQEIKETLKEALAIPSPSCQEAFFTEYVIQKFLEIGVEAQTDDLLSRYAALPDFVQKGLNCDGGRTPPNSGNVVAKVPGTDPRMPSVHLSFHLDRRPDPDLTVLEKGGRLYSDGKTILGADDAAGFAIIYHVVKLLREQKVPHGEIVITGLVAEEDSGVGARLVDDANKRGDVGLVVDGALSNEVNNGGADLYFGSFRVEQAPIAQTKALPFNERFSLVIEGTTQHPAYSDKGISAIGVAVQILKALGINADGSVKGEDKIRAVFRLEGGKRKEASPPKKHPEAEKNGNRVPAFARIDFLLKGDSAGEIQGLKERILEKLKASPAKFSLLNSAVGDAPAPGNVSALVAETLIEMDLRHDQHPGGDPEAIFQVDEIIATAPATVEGGWQLRCTNPNKTEILRKKWGETLAQVSQKYHGRAYVNSGGKTDGYKLPEGDPSLAAVLGGYRMAGIPRPKVTPTFGGSNVNAMIKDRGSMVLMPTAADFLHTEKECWDLMDGLRAAQILFGTILFVNGYERITRD